MPEAAPVSLSRRVLPLHAAIRRASCGAPRRALVGAALVLLSGLGAFALPRAAAAVVGGARSKPYPEAVASTKLAALAVLDRDGAESCLRGKLTNALLGLSASCEAAGERNPLCQLADRAAASTGWSIAFMDTTAQQLLALIDPARPRP
ncbi:hypothetical protein KBZ20_04885 [Vulcanococcus limneticus Candia 3F8]|uniref:hypothetical protein n=1 Tax=Vulcanococcus limneticus TaxID=2170428 RepID=UPI000B994F1C|nr:hypothetical protein [Vulcanococcus limneticus]MCP9792030.1 hypothetical protein [Vulcanococcus limneticus MW73D5]MCP9893105.1 hypothetical protein [Vulcanococcus limneticus Candia 3F8]MCP9897429.1 hypothetical protein [Vulcanococcus limneticus Candia 3B3]